MLHVVEKSFGKALENKQIKLALTGLLWYNVEWSCIFKQYSL